MCPNFWGLVCPNVPQNVGVFLEGKEIRWLCLLRYLSPTFLSRFQRSYRLAIVGPPSWIFLSPKVQCHNTIVLCHPYLRILGIFTKVWTA